MSTLIASVILLASLEFKVFAADCFGDKGLNPWTPYAWDLRQAACGDGACSAQFQDADKSKCSLSMPLGDGWQVLYDATDGSGNYQNWFVHIALPSTLTDQINSWDATEDILNQCWVNGGPYSDSSHTSSGKWTDGDSYTLTINKDDQIVINDYGNDGEIGADPPPPTNPEPPTISQSTPSASQPSATQPASGSPDCPTVPPCPAGKACPDPKPCDQLTCNNDCVGVIPNPAWCNLHCGGIN